jgi:hypothetical protein
MKRLLTALAAALPIALAVGMTSFAQSEKTNPKAASPAPTGSSATTFTGKSIHANVQEALNDALKKAQLALTKNVADARFEYRVETIQGVRGGIAGQDELTLEIKILP